MKEYISQEQADRIAANLELQQGFTKRDLYRLCNAVRADFIKELLGKDVEPIGYASPSRLRDLKEGRALGINLVALSEAVLDGPPGTGELDIPLITTTQVAAMVLQERGEVGAKRRAEEMGAGCRS